MLKTKSAAARTAATSLLIGAACVSTAAQAATTTSTLNVSATVTANCTVSTSALAFGNVDTLSGANVDGTGGLSVTCTNGTPWAAAAGVGSGALATFASRKMAAGAQLLNYNLYTNAGRTTVWGDGTASTATLGGTGTGAVQSVSVYGRVGSGQSSVPAGSYADTVQVTVTY